MNAAIGNKETQQLESSLKKLAETLGVPDAEASVRILESNDDTDCTKLLYKIKNAGCAGNLKIYDALASILPKVEVLSRGLNKEGEDINFYPTCSTGNENKTVQEHAQLIEAATIKLAKSATPSGGVSSTAVFDKVPNKLAI